MILKEIRLNNFKCFKGEQRIRFSSESGTTMITVIVGENGTGKTSLCDAIKFCVWNDHGLSEDKYSASLINSTALDESESTGNPVETTVCLDFEHKGYCYSLKRSILLSSYKGKTPELYVSAVLDRWDTSGTKQTFSDPDVVSTIIESIFDYRVCDLFFLNSDTIWEVSRSLGKTSLLMSMSDSQSLTISFMLAVIRKYIDKNKVELPLMMDSLFDRVDTNHRKKLLDIILDEHLQFQCVFLLIGNESHNLIFDEIRQCGKYGLCYTLKKTGKNNGSVWFEAGI